MPDIQDDPFAASLAMARMALSAAEQGARLVCFPECYLQGYTLDRETAAQRALELASPELAALLEPLVSVPITLIVGVIEKHEGKLCNTAVVVNRGRVLGRYRKARPNEKYFEAGTEFPTFRVEGLEFGINICNDANFSEPLRPLLSAGVSLVCYPLNNMLPRATAEVWRHRHLENLVRCAVQGRIWVLSSDVVAACETKVGYGCTAIVDPRGQVAVRAEEGASALVIHEISA